MQKLLVLLVLSLTGCSSNNVSIVGESASYQARDEAELSEASEGTYPNGPTCSMLDTDWGAISLYRLTYGCIPRGWEVWFRNTEVRSEISKISDQLSQDMNSGKYLEPNIGEVFKALYEVPPDQVKAVILGQDPAPEKGIAMGLSFSTPKGESSSVTPSIQRVLLEAQNEGYCVDLENGNLEAWANQGVLLLNMALTINCDSGKDFCNIASHLDLWSNFTDQLFEELNESNEAKAFIFWGGAAGNFSSKITNRNHTVLQGGHPSPAGSENGERFFCKSYFNNANDWLNSRNRAGVDWKLINSCSNMPPASNWTWHPDTKTSTIYSACK